MKLAIEIPNLVLIFFQLILWNKLRESEPIRLLEMTGSLACNYFNSRTLGSRKLFIHIRQFFYSDCRLNLSIELVRVVYLQLVGITTPCIWHDSIICRQY